MDQSHCLPLLSPLTPSSVLESSRIRLLILASSLASLSLQTLSPCDLYDATTAPVPPDREALISFVNATRVKLNLASWKSGGCPITGFTVKYKQRQEVMWTAIADSTENPVTVNRSSGSDGQEGVVLIDGLHPQTWYSIQVTAASDAGSSEAEYSILTPAFRDASKC